jgi:hypothetical protein
MLTPSRTIGNFVLVQVNIFPITNIKKEKVELPFYKHFEDV